MCRGDGLREVWEGVAGGRIEDPQGSIGEAENGGGKSGGVKGEGRLDLPWVSSKKRRGGNWGGGGRGGEKSRKQELEVEFLLLKKWDPKKERGTQRKLNRGGVAVRRWFLENPGREKRERRRTPTGMHGRCVISRAT